MGKKKKEHHLSIEEHPWYPGKPDLPGHQQKKRVARNKNVLLSLDYRTMMMRFETGIINESEWNEYQESLGLL